MERQQPVEILLAEDNPGDVGLIRLAFRETDLPAHLSVVPDGTEALAFLRREGSYRDARRPDLLVLDLNLPGVDGREVLRLVKADPAFQTIPVVVLTSSPDQHDVARAYADGASCYVVKPLDLDRFLETVGQVERFWLTTARLPPEGHSGPGGAVPRP